jgi:hypothetical protein
MERIQPISSGQTLSVTTHLTTLFCLTTLMNVFQPVNFVNHLDPNAPKQIKRNISLLENINWPQWITSTTSPPLFTFLDPAPSVAITPDTFREGPINLLIDIAGKLFK